MSVNPNKALLVTDGIYPMTIGGMQRHAYYLLLSLLKRNWEVDVYLPEELETGPFFEVLPKEFHPQVNLVRIPYPRYRIPFTYVPSERAYSRNLYKHISNRRDLDRIQAILTKGFTASSWPKKRKGFPQVISQLHGLEMFQMTFDFRSKLAAKSLQSVAMDALKSADKILCYGGKIKELHSRLLGSEDKLHVFHGGLLEKNLMDQIQETRTPVRFLFIGRNERRKGIPELLALLNRALDQKLPFEIDWIGELEEGLIPPFSSFKYHGVVRSIDDYFKIVDSCDVLLLPSISEGFPTVLPESMGRGLTSLAMDVGAVSQLVNQKTGWLSKNHDQFETFFHEIVQQEPASIDAKKRQALLKVKAEFTWDSLGNELQRIIKL